VERVRRIVLITMLLALASLAAQEKKPWERDRLCGKLDYVRRIPDRKNPGSFSEKRKALRDIPLGLYARHANEACCGSLNAVETSRSGRGGSFAFETKKPGDYWLATNWNGKEYKLAVVYKPEKNSKTLCSEQGIALDDEGNADWWAIVTVD
jgi:hypothetical protein